MKKGFTLAETLITLIVIGVVAALTIPSLFQTYKEHEIVSKFKKFYSTISNAYNLAVAENGTIDKWSFGGDSWNFYQRGAGSQIIMEKFLPYLNITKKCDYTDDSCSPNTSYVNLSKTQTWGDNNLNNSNFARIILSDGTLIAFNALNPDCNTENKKICVQIEVDLNGAYKGPNQMGYDTFEIEITPRGIGVAFPDRFNDDDMGNTRWNKICNKDSSDSYNGGYCAGWILYKGNMNYLHETTYW